MAVNFKDHADLGGNRIENLADPTADQHAATRAYVLAQIAAAGGYTDENARDAIAAALVAGNNIDIAVNDAGDTITIDVEALTSADLSDFATAVQAVITAAYINALAGVDADTLGGATLGQVRDHSQTTGARLATSSTSVAATQRLLGRGTAGAGATEELTVTGGIEFSGTAVRTTAFTGDVTKPAGGTETTIANDAVSNAKLADMAQNTIKGRATAATGDPEDLTAAQVKALLAIAPTDISGFDAAAVAAANAGVIDADTLGGSTKAQVIADAIAGVVDTAPTTLDTLNELAAALGDDPNFAATITAQIATKTGKYAANVGNGSATSIAVNHNLNTRDVTVEVYDAATYDTVLVDVVRTTVNQVTLGFSTAPAANAYRVVVVG